MAYLQEYKAYYPEYTDWDDWDIAGKLYDENPEYSEAGIGFDDFGKNIGITKKRSRYHLKGAAKQLVADVGQGLATFAPRQVGKLIPGEDRFERYVTQQDEAEQRRAFEDRDRREFHRSVADENESLLTEAIGSAGHTALGLGMSAVPYIGVPMAYTHFYDLNKREVKEAALAKGADPETAENTAIVGGAINSLLDMIGVGKLSKAFKPGRKLVQRLLNMGESGVAEGVTERTQDVVGDIASQYAAKDPSESTEGFVERIEKDWPNIWKRSKRAGEVGAAMGLMFGGLGGVSSPLQKPPPKPETDPGDNIIRDDFDPTTVQNEVDTIINREKNRADLDEADRQFRGGIAAADYVGQRQATAADIEGLVEVTTEFTPEELLAQKARDKVESNRTFREPGHPDIEPMGLSADPRGIFKPPKIERLTPEQELLAQDLKPTPPLVSTEGAGAAPESPPALKTGEAVETTDLSGITISDIAIDESGNPVMEIIDGTPQPLTVQRSAQEAIGEIDNRLAPWKKSKDGISTYDRLLNCLAG